MREKIKRAIVPALLTALCSIALAGPTKPSVEVKSVSKTLPFSVKVEFSRTLGRGKVATKTTGKDGKLITTYEVKMVNGKVVSKNPIRSQRIDPIDHVMLVGPSGYSTSRSSFTRSKVLTMNSTGYDTSPQTLPGSSGRTAMGIPARFGVVAVDPRVIKLGTYVFVEGYGFALACDTGGAIKGHKIDLCFNSRAEALRWGRRPVKVHILTK